MSHLKAEDSNVSRAIKIIEKQIARGGRATERGFVLLASLVIMGIGILAISIPICFEEETLKQPTFDKIAHRGANWAMTKFFELLDRGGEAAIIAGLLGIAVDRAGKSKFVKEVVDQASPLLLGPHLPDPVRVASLQNFNQNFYRPTWRVDLTLSLLKQQTDWVRIRSTISGTVVNCTMLEQDFIFWCGVDPTPPGVPESQITRIAAFPENGARGKSFDKRPVNSELVQADRTKLISEKFSVGSNEKWTTIFEYNECRPISCLLPVFVGTTVVTAIITIGCNPQEDKNLWDFRVSTGIGDQLEPGPTGEWEIDGPILTGQAVVITLIPKAVPQSIEKSGDSATAVPRATVDVSRTPTAAVNVPKSVLTDKQELIPPQS